MEHAPDQAPRAEEVTFGLDETTVRLLHDAGPSPRAAALAAFAVTVGAYDRTEAVVVGVAFDGRSTSDTEGMVGPFVIDLTAAADPAALFDQVNTALLAGGAPDPAPALGAVSVVGHRSRAGAELHLTGEPGGPVVGRLRYAAGLFDRDTAERISRTYRVVLARLLTDPRQPLTSVDVLLPEERTLLFEAWHTTDPTLLTDLTVSDLFTRQAHRTPDRTAVSFGAERLTYAELNSHANQLAAHLAGHGVGPESVVGLCLPRGLSLMTAVLGIMKAGGAYLPLDPGSTRVRNELLLTTARARLVVTRSDLVALLPPDDGVRFVPLDGDDAELRCQPAEDFPQRATADNAVYVLHTSGSTGVPKGVVMTHRALTNLLGWQLRRTEVAGPTLQFSSTGFDVSFQEMFATWLAGGELVLTAEDDRRDPERLWAVMHAAGVRRLFCPPMVLDQLAHVPPDTLPPLAEIITAGETLRITPKIRRLLDRLPGVTLDNQYGPTETHVISGHRLTGPVDGWPVLPPIGRTIPNARVYLLDDQRRPVPVGGVGEIHIGGVSPARGYIGRPELTDERFVPDPFSARGGRVMYRTGDLARRRADGVLTFLGRADQQVKIRGYRVEPGEVEAALVAHDTVEEAAVLPVEVQGDRRLAAYLVAATDATLSGAELRAALRERLPEYMVPAYFVPVGRLPLTHVGKIDRAQLPDPTAPRVDGRDSDSDPAVGVTAQLTEILGEVVGVAGIGPDDSFFDIGGHSLLAMRVVERIRTELSAQLSVRDLFANPTVARLASVITARHTGESSGDAGGLRIERRARRDVAPLSAFQHSTWLLHQIYPDCVAYHMPLLFLAEGAIDATALDQALTMLVARHDVFRTAFTHNSTGAPVQRISPAEPARFAAVDLRHLPSDQREQRLADIIDETVGTPFDLTRAPLWRAVRVVMGDERCALLFVMHHLVTDGWSMEIIKAELSEAYRASRGGEPPCWPEQPLQHGDLAAWEAGPENAARLARELRFWRERVDVTVPPLQLPTARRATRRGFTDAAVRGTLGTATTAAVRTLTGAVGASAFSVLLSAFALLLARYSGQDRVNVGAPLIVRDQPPLDETVGFLTNTIVLECDVAQGSFADVVGRTQSRVADALAHPHLPFESLVADLGPRRDPQRNPLFDTWFNMLSIPRRDLALDGVLVREQRPPLAGALFDLAAYVRDEGTDIEIELVFRSDLFTRDRVAVMLDHLVDLIGRACADPTVAAGRLAPPPPVRSARSFAPPAAVSIVDRVRERASTWPERTAVTGGAAVSYRALQADVRRLADMLAAAGLGPGRVAAIAARRDPGLLTAMLAVRAAGGAFSVLDLSFSGHRLASALTQLNASVLVTLDAEPLPTELAQAARDIVRVGLHRPAPGPARPDDADGHPAYPADLAYVAFTSGTTGSPLGVLATETPTTTFFEWYARALDLGQEDRFSVLAGLSHDPLLRETLLPLWIGATACVPDNATLSFPTETVAWLADQACTVVHLTPALGRVLAAAAEPAGSCLPAVRVVGLGGAPVHGGDHAALRRLFPHARIVSLYGATETPQGMSIVDLAAEFPPDRQHRHPPLGGGSPGAELLVVGPGGRACAVNEVGEIAVRSPYLALGYLGESAPAHRFRPDPDGDPAVRLYLTGDVGRYRPDLTVEFLGRADDQLSLNGLRLEPGDVEHAARQHAAVAECTAFSHGGRLILAVGSTHDLTTEELRRHLGEWLPPTMIPHEVVVLPGLPMTPNDKPDRARIVAGLAAREQGDVGAPEFGPLLDEVVAVLRDALGVPAVAVDDTFFDSGASSLGLLRAHLELRDRFDQTLELAHLFEFQTPRRLAARLSGDVTGAGHERVSTNRRGQLDRLRRARQHARCVAARERRHHELS